MLCILHDLNLALHYFDKLLVLSEGEVAAFGPPDEVLQPELLEAVYGVRAYLHQHAGRTYLTFSPRLRGERRGRVHLICGGGTGAGLMRELVDAGYEVTAGVLNALDTDEETGRDLGLQMAVEAPFSPVGDEAHAENLRCCRRRPGRRRRRAGQPRQRAQPRGGAGGAGRRHAAVGRGGRARRRPHRRHRAPGSAGAEFFAGQEALLTAVRARSLSRVRPDVRRGARVRESRGITDTTIRRQGRRRRETGGRRSPRVRRPASLHHPGARNTRPGSRTAASPAEPSGIRRARREARSPTAARGRPQASSSQGRVSATAIALTKRPGRVLLPTTRPGRWTQLVATDPRTALVRGIFCLTGQAVQSA